MAKYTVSAACGHTEVLELYGKTTQRERRIAWAEAPGGMCKACYAASKRVHAATARAMKYSAPVRAQASADAHTDEQLRAILIDNVSYDFFFETDRVKLEAAYLKLYLNYQPKEIQS